VSVYTPETYYYVLAVDKVYVETILENYTNFNDWLIDFTFYLNLIINYSYYNNPDFSFENLWDYTEYGFEVPEVMAMMLELGYTGFSIPPPPPSLAPYAQIESFYDLNKLTFEIYRNGTETWRFLQGDYHVFINYPQSSSVWRFKFEDAEWHVRNLIRDESEIAVGKIDSAFTWNHTAWRNDEGDYLDCYTYPIRVVQVKHDNLYLKIIIKTIAPVYLSEILIEHPILNDVIVKSSSHGIASAESLRFVLIEKIELERGWTTITVNCKETTDLDRYAVQILIGIVGGSAVAGGIVLYWIQRKNKKKPKKEYEVIIKPIEE